MKIAVNARLLRKNEMDGLGWFTYNTMKYITKQNPQIEFHLLFDSGIEKDFIFSDNVIAHNLFPPAKHAILNVIWFEWSVKMLLNKLKPDLFISLDGLLSLGWKGKQYGLIADLNFLHNPRDLKWSNSKYYNYFFPRYAKKSFRIGTISKFSKDDIVKQYQIDPEKIDIVYCGINSFFVPLSSEKKTEVKAALTSGDPYFIFVGTLHPRKNIVRLLQAFETFKKDTSAKVKLVIAGKEMYKVDEIYKTHEQLQHKADVIFTGRIDDEKLNEIIGAALALTFVPLFEGFGIPIIEAMQCEVPVICSNVTSMPEVAGDAALLVDPYNVDEIAFAMKEVYLKEYLRSDLILKGNKQKELFTWSRTADLLWSSITKCF
jgi:glycosyltransferase involved in cell wall biosynthesis